MRILLSFCMLFLVINQSALASGWFSTQSDYLTTFKKATECYKNSDYFCATQNYSDAAWHAKNDLARGRAIFNLANAHYKLANYQQAAILFKNAEKWGVDSQAVKTNYAFANALAKSVTKMIDDINKIKRKANWREESQDISELINDRITEGRYLPTIKKDNSVFNQLTNEQINRLLLQGLNSSHNNVGKLFKVRDKTWVKTIQAKQKDTTAALLNQLFSIEVGLPVVADRPSSIKGQRQW